MQKKEEYEAVSRITFISGGSGYTAASPARKAQHKASPGFPLLSRSPSATYHYSAKNKMLVHYVNSSIFYNNVQAISLFNQVNFSIPLNPLTFVRSKKFIYG